MKRLFLIPVCVFFAILIFGCCEHQTNKLSNAVITNVKTSDCLLSEQNNTFAKSMDSLTVQYSDHTLFITQFGLWIVCATDIINTSIQTSNDTIRVFESGRTDDDCVCKVNHAFQIENVPPGVYVLEIYYFNFLNYQQTYDLR